MQEYSGLTQRAKHDQVNGIWFHFCLFVCLFDLSHLARQKIYPKLWQCLPLCSIRKEITQCLYLFLPRCTSIADRCSGQKWGGLLKKTCCLARLYSIGSLFLGEIQYSYQQCTVSSSMHHCDLFTIPWKTITDECYSGDA